MNEIPRQKLVELVTEYGASLARDARLCEGHLKDVCGEYKLEINVLVSAIKCGATGELIDLRNGQTTPSSLTPRLVKKLVDEYGLAEEPAHWAIISWASALGVISPGQAAATSTGFANSKPPVSQNAPASLSNSAKILYEFSSTKAEELASPLHLPYGAVIIQLTVKGKGWYGLTLFDCNGKKIGGIERSLNYSRSISRVAVFKISLKNPGPFALAVNVEAEWTIKISSTNA